MAISEIQKDRPAFLASFLKTFMGVGAITSPVSTETLQWNHALAMQAAPWATIDCVRAFAQTDFRPDLPSFNKPTLVIHGDADKIVPLELNSALVHDRYTALGGTMELIVPPGQGHNMWPGFFESPALVAFVKANARR